MTGYAETTTYAAARPVLEACGRRRRFFAALLDGVVLAFVGMMLGIAITLAFDGSLESFGLEQSPGTTTWNSGIGDDLGGTALAISVVMTVLTAVYFVGFHATTGQTPGKGMLGIKVVDIHTGEAPKVGTSILRYAIYAGPGVAGFAMSFAESLAPFSYTMDIAWLVIVGWILFEGTRRGLHDIIAETAVVRTRPPAREMREAGPVGSGW